jgi:hypothetical protein
VVLVPVGEGGLCNRDTLGKPAAAVLELVERCTLEDKAVSCTNESVGLEGVESD